MLAFIVMMRKSQNMKHLLPCIVAWISLLPLNAVADDEHPVIAPGAKLEKLAGGFRFTEGATCDPHGNVFFVDQPNNRIHKWSTAGELSTFMDPAGRANGMSFDKEGRLFVCADEKNQLWEVSPEGEVTVLVKGFESALLNGPNDVFVHPSGALYFTDPFYKRPWWEHAEMPQPGQQVYRLSADRKDLTRVTEDLAKPNGIIGTPDGKRLFVADMDEKKTYLFDISPDGSLANKAVFCELGSDGMTIDSEGNLYLTGKGVTIFDKTGKQIGHIEVAENWTANLCFGGVDRDTLFITASTGFYAVKTRFKGANPGK